MESPWSKSNSMMPVGRDFDSVVEKAETVNERKETAFSIPSDGNAISEKKRTMTKIEKEMETNAATESGSLTWADLRERLDDVELIIYVLKKKRKRLGKAMIDRNLEEEVYDAIRFLKEEANLIVYSFLEISQFPFPRLYSYMFTRLHNPLTLT